MQDLPLFISIAGNIAGVIGLAFLALKLVDARADARLGAQVREQREAALRKARAANAAKAKK